MIAVDTNLLVYAHRVEMPKHEPAKAALTRLAEGAEAWAIPVFCLGEFLRVITHSRLFDPPHSLPEATRAVQALLGSPSLRLLTPGDRYVPLLLAAMEEADATGNLVFDCQIVALCRESGVRALWSEDRDFDRFRDFPTLRL